jgi:hypothetical protein
MPSFARLIQFVLPRMATPCRVDDVSFQVLNRLEIICFSITCDYFQDWCRLAQSLPSRLPSAGFDDSQACFWLIRVNGSGQASTLPLHRFVEWIALSNELRCARIKLGDYLRGMVHGSWKSCDDVCSVFRSSSAVSLAY